MTASFTLALDTRAPVLTWGPVQDAIAGETIRVSFLVDEPGLKSASIKLLDGRTLPMTVVGGELRADLPSDAPDGQAVVTATTRDSVWNERVFTLNVLVSGTQVEPPPHVDIQPTGMPVAHPTLISAAPSSCSARASYRGTAVSSTRSRIVARSRYSAPGFRQKWGIHGSLRMLTPPDELNVAVSTRTAARTASDGAATASSGNRVVKRPEGPGAEDELILLDLL